MNATNSKFLELLAHSIYARLLDEGLLTLEQYEKLLKM